MEPSISIDLRFGPGDAPPVDPSRTDPAGQAAAIAEWGRLWSSGTRVEPAPARKAFPAPRDLPYPVGTPDGGQVPAMLRRARELKAADDRARRASHVPVRGDFEHFHEDAALLAAAAATGHPVHVYRHMDEVLRLNGDMDPGAGRPKVDLRTAGRSSRAVDRYWELPAFRAAAGRLIAETSAGMLHWMAMAFLDAGHDRVFLKSTVVKRGTWTLELPPGSTAASVRAALHALVGETLLDWVPEGSGPGFLVQGHVPFSREFRFFVVGNRIVRGIPVRRADTVFDRVSRGRIEPRSCRAHDGFPSEPDRGRAARYTRVARRIIAALAPELTVKMRSCPPRVNYVLDLGETPDGVILPIELNSLVHSGLYSCDPGAIVAALLDAERRIEAAGEALRGPAARVAPVDPCGAEARSRFLRILDGLDLDGLPPAPMP